MMLWISALLSLALIHCCQADDTKNKDSKWELVKGYANFDAPPYGDSSTTHEQCRKACQDLKGCTGYDWYPYGTSTHCWVGNNSPVSLTCDIENHHFIPKNKKNSYKPFDDTEWKVVKHYANYDAPPYGDNTTTHCQCRQACIDLPGCTGYDWYPYGTGTHCWVGNNCPVTLTYDESNVRYVPEKKVKCYPKNTKFTDD